MKKLLIVSLFLLSMIGLFASEPHTVVFDLQTEAGGYHEAADLGYKICTVNPFGQGEQWTPTTTMYSNWPGIEDSAGLNNAATLYLDGTDPDTPGRLLVQMAGFESWGQEWGGPTNAVTANFYFVDGEGNETGPYNVAKASVGAITYYDDGNGGHVVAWGGPAGPTVEWCETPSPMDGATEVATTVTLSAVSPEGSDASLYDIYYRMSGAVDWMTAVTENFEPSMEVNGLAYSQMYEWKIEPFAWTDMPGGDKTYPTGDAPVWSFTTMAEPVVGPDAWAMVDMPADEATDVELMPTLTWTYEGTVVPDGYEVYVDGFYQDDVVGALEYTIDEPLDYNTNHTWSIKPFVNNAAKRVMKKALRNEPEAKLYPEGDMPVWSFTTTDNYETDVPVVIEGTPVTVTLETVFTGTVPSDWTPNAPVSIPAPIIPLPVLAGAFQFGATINQGVAGTFTYTFQIGDTDFEGVLYVDGVQQFAGIFGGGTVIVTLTFTGAKDGHEVVVTEPTLPVELSSFTAQAHANEYVTLKWVTESESNLQGYNVYRAETDNQDQAIRINPTVVAANNQTQTQTYTYTDNEVEATTYYYWLEVAELANENTFHGPIVVTVEDDPVVPGITETTFRNFGPSPFTESTSTTLRVKEGETATVTIYNLLGQVVRRESFNAGEHNFEFNGRDLNNKKVANGIYFVRMTSPTQTHNFKIVKIK